MTNLQQFEQNGLELIIDLATGEVFANQNAIARMCNVSKVAISKYVSVNKVDSKTAEVQLGVGLRSVNLYSEDAIYDALAKYNPQLLAQCAKAGLRIYLHGLAGFKYEVKQSEVKPKTALELAKDYLELAKEQVKLLEHLEQLKAEKEANAPLVKYAQAIQFSDDCVDFNTYAKMIGNIGRNKLMQRCRDAHVLMQNSTLPYQRWIDAGYFEVSQEINMNNGKLIPFTLITGKGQIWLKQKLDNHENLTRNAVNAIAQGVLAFGGF